VAPSLSHANQMLGAQAVFGIGVGGEYPIASTSASERAEADVNLQHRRGETVMLTFSMQGADHALCRSAAHAPCRVVWQGHQCSGWFESATLTGCRGGLAKRF